MPRKCTECGSLFESEIRHCPEDGAPTITTDDETSLIGQVIDGRFSINGFLGVGGMGAVYRAHQFSTDRDVALKLLRRNLVEDEDTIRRFFREAKASSRLANPHAVTVFDFGQTSDGILYLVMELVKGQPLSDYLRSHPGPMEIRRAARIIIQVLDALVEAHDARIVHRDLKPGNVLLLDNDLHRDFVKVSDFGLAKMVEGDAQALSQSGLVLGTPEYMSPEQAQGFELDARSDLYSVGVMLFELLSGTLPVEAETAMATMMKKIREEPLSLGEAVPQARVPEPVEALVAGLLKSDPDQRPATAREVREILIGGIDAPAAAPRTPPTVEVPPVSTGVPAKARRTLTWPRLTGGFAVVAITGILAAWAASGGTWNGDTESVVLVPDVPVADLVVTDPTPVAPTVDGETTTEAPDTVTTDDGNLATEEPRLADVKPPDPVKPAKKVRKKARRGPEVLRLLKRRDRSSGNGDPLPLKRREE